VKREDLIKNLETSQWDVIIIGGGATGLGSAVDAASRGYRTLLLEAHDFAKASSSRSTKLVHGGVRYLQQGNVHLVREALRERRLLTQNAPHLVHPLPLLVPLYHWWERPYYGTGLKLYDLLAGRMGYEPSRHLLRDEAIDTVPTINSKGLRGGVVYFDGQMDDARLAISLAQTAAREGATVLNYFKVTSLIKADGKIAGVHATDCESGDSYMLYAKVVINATGIFTDEIREMDEPGAPCIVPSQGVHLVLPQTFLDSKTAILVPRTDDGRVVFLIPWLGRVIVGTTDTPLDKPVLEPSAKEEEIDFLLRYASRYLDRPPSRSDIVSQFAGIRPLVRSRRDRKTSSLARDHVIMTSPAGLVSIAGGKWTTYRKMAEDVVDQAARVGLLPRHECTTSTLQLFGYATGGDPQNPISAYGLQQESIEKLCEKDPGLKRRLTPGLSYSLAHVQWAVDHEMARTLEDVLSRRTRLLILDARGALHVAPDVARFMARHLGRSKDWELNQVDEFARLAKNYLPSPC
jgi:glycerol-3-phosphate dehydrogenase